MPLTLHRVSTNNEDFEIMKQKRIAYAVLALIISLVMGVDAYRQLKNDVPPHTPPPVASSAPQIQQIPQILPQSNYEPYNGLDYDVVNDNKPFFGVGDITTESFEYYGELDELGRCTVAYACLGLDTMPPKGEERGDISEVHPTGWVQNSYDLLAESNPDKPFLYERCHLGAWCLTNENANERNLVTGTQHMNATMWQFEQQVQSYIYQTGNHVMYRVTPEFREERDLLPYGVTMEAYSVEDNGTLSFCVFCYNNQDGIEFNYANGDNRLMK